jgi:hypothetical protein
MDIHKLLINKMVEVRNLEDIKSEMPDRTKLIDIIPVYGLIKAGCRFSKRVESREKMLYSGDTLDKRYYEQRVEVAFENLKDSAYTTTLLALNIIYGFGIYELAKEMFN